MNSEPEILPEHPPHLHPQTALGDRLADHVARFGGSWTFIGCFFALMLVWMGLNVFGLLRPFDPYPFILLNLVLSCIAAIQAPVIMMSQNRKDQRDRLRAIHDYRVNRKAEQEIRLLHDKLDRLTELLASKPPESTN